MPSLQPWAFKGEETEQSTEEREEERRCLGSTKKKPHFGAPDCCPGLPVTMQYPQQPLPTPAAWYPGSAAVGTGVPASPGDRQAHWEVPDHDGFTLGQEGGSPHLWMLSGRE